jgi:hypothetical protein
MNEAGKGDTQRPMNHQKFMENFEKIFGVTQKSLSEKMQKEYDKKIKKELDENNHPR